MLVLLEVITTFILTVVWSGMHLIDINYPVILRFIYLTHMKYFGGIEICGKTHDYITIALVGQISANNYL